MDPLGQLAQLGEGDLELLSGVVKGRPDLGTGIGRQSLLDPTQGQRQRDQPLLRAIVEVPLDTASFGTALHPTTAMCLEAIDEATQHDPPARLLDVGTGSGVLALAALRLGVPTATAVDVDAEAVRVASANAVLNGLDARLTLLQGGTDVVEGAWPYVVANVLAAPLIEMAPALVRRVGHYGRLVFTMIARHFLSEEQVVGLLGKDRDFGEDEARALYHQVQGRDYNPPRRDKILEWQAQQDFPILPNADDPDAGNVYRDLTFPDGVYQDIEAYHEQKAEAGQ